MRIISRSPADTRKIARRIAAKLKPADILCLFGPFGAGKTVFAKGLAQGLGIKSRDVISPSFVLLRRHNYGRLPLFHFDL
jgi:tRNA threonylcarbamoyladenosine biosynthesis protein TsaE